MYESSTPAWSPAGATARFWLHRRRHVATALALVIDIAHACGTIIRRKHDAGLYGAKLHFTFRMQFHESPDVRDTERCFNPFAMRRLWSNALM